MRVLPLQLNNLSHFFDHPDDLYNYYVVFNVANKSARNHIYNRCVDMYLVPINLARVIRYSNYTNKFNLTTIFSNKMIKRTEHNIVDVLYKIKDFIYELKTNRILIKRY